MLIGITGKKFSGKDTVADYLVNKFGFIKRSLAQPLKDGVKGFFGFSDSQLWGDKKEEVDKHWHVSARRVLQIVGTEIFRDKIGEFIPELDWVKDEFWIKAFEYWYAGCFEDVVVPDIRYPNEADMIVRNGGKIIKVHRDGIVGGDAHKSENMINEISYHEYLNNNYSLEDLYIKINKAMENLK